MEQNTPYAIAESWEQTEGALHDIEEILDWVATRNKVVVVDIQKSTLSASSLFYDENRVPYIKNSFSVMDFEKGQGVLMLARIGEV